LVSRTVSPLYCARYLRPHHEPERFPRWLLLVSVVFAGVGLTIWSIGAWAPLPLEQLSLNVRQVLFGTPRRPDLAATMAHLSQRPNVTDLLRELFPALGVYGILVGLGIAGGFELTVAGMFWIAPLFNVLFERFTAVYEFLLRVCLRVRWAVLLLLTL